MTIEINLLPWREELRARRSKRFYLALALVALLGLGGGYAMTWYYQQQHEAQLQRNAHVQAQSRELDEAIREISELEAIREEMLEQVQLFTELQLGRTQTVHVMSDLTTSLVEGVYYTQLNRQGDSLRLAGLAENNRQVSDQLRALAAAASFSEPVLSEVEAEGEAEGEPGRRFSLSMSQQLPGREQTSADQDELAGGGS
ncbi:PilN domain-containing protein [Halomonas urumqiensis]|uniref:Fimbrial assembly protein n=1 Tax=Halomonas urumqiensis TaxID=1684789 RepID=A0A2N7UIM4_9GAMM|nr:PilN domain-containing protein [Halomonas urumqiensis]PMR80288.1 fimbrial assembly protein [Halomonas urumqiensis]PTB01609.1 fimbrial assembly protein [Halomonas urumqiensis]GHE22300.1 pilus assembly protein PilN [Halomonas urumqiensis]